MQLFVGTSGFSYKEWKGNFYPEKIKNEEMLSYYAERLTAVEINNTFYRMPKKEFLDNWAAQVPDSFRFSIKASQKITHQKRLKEADEETKYLTETVLTLKEKLGVVLFQFPPYFKKDSERLNTFLQMIPERFPAAFEFRNESWFHDETYKKLQEKNCALVITETDEAPEADFIKTADWTYLRLRRASYTETELKERITKIKDNGWEKVFVFFKHEDEGTGPRLAGDFIKLAG